MHESEASSLGEKMGLMDRTDVSINSRMGIAAARLRSRVDVHTIRPEQYETIRTTRHQPSLQPCSRANTPQRP